jgi:Ca2+-transporting ATPase
VFSEVFRAFAARSTTRVFWEVGPLSNLKLIGVVALTVLIQVGLHHVPATRELFQISPLSPGDLALSIVLGLTPVTLVELHKLVTRAAGSAARRARRGGPGSRRARAT